jgi:hypothetical protein
MNSTYLPSSSMVATSNTMALASNVLGFDIIELWSTDSGGKMICPYIHATNEIIQRFPDMIKGPYPARKDVVHVISPKVFELL